MQSNIEFRLSTIPVEYNDSLKQMEDRVKDVQMQNAPELIWFLEHPAIYTAGVSTNMDDLLNPYLLPVIKTNRGGQFTYHGPGQIIIYTIIDIKKRNLSIRQFVHSLQDIIIKSLKHFEIEGFPTDDIGVWVNTNSGIKKISAIGLKIRHFISFHGISLNVSPNLSPL